ncbi:MAG: hypothetical protein IJJ26_13085 [Victivallales bacterium]|nr:hypothetical protein [Victivallales bacterium]
MMNINATNATNNVDWSKISDLITQGPKKASGDVQVNKDNSLTITVNDKNGVARSTTVSIPVLDKFDTMSPAEQQNALQTVDNTLVALSNQMFLVGNLSQEDANRLVAAINTLQQDTKNVSFSHDTSKVLFDIYALMALMVEVAQKQRDATREIRLVENQQIQNSIQAQADMIASAAMTALIMGIVSTAVSGVMSTVTMARQASAFKTQMSENQGLTSLQNDLKSASLANDPVAAMKNFSSVKSNTSQGIVTEVDAVFDPLAQNIDTTISNATTAVNNTKTELATAKQQLLDLEGQEPPAEPAALEQARTNVQTKQEAYDAAKLNLMTSERELFGQMDSKIKDVRTNIAQVQEQLDAKNAQLATAAEGDKPAIQQEITDLQGQLKNLQAKDNYMCAYRAKVKSQFASEGMRQMDLSRAQSSYDMGVKALEHNEKYMSAVQQMNRWTGVQQLSMAIAQLMGTIGSSLAENQRAAGQVEQKDQVQHQEQLDQIKDLHSQALTLVQSVIQLMQAVLSAENDSVLESIRA